MPITKGTELVESVFGGVIDDDSAGFYTSLEFFGILGGTLRAELPILPQEGDVQTRENGADFARRYAWPPQDTKDIQLRISADDLDIFEGDLNDYSSARHRPLKDLISALAAPRRPGTRNPRTWTGSHLMPYSRELAHWDIAGREPDNGGQNTKVQNERYYLRGAGALVHKIIRCDDDDARLSSVRDKLKDMLDNSSSTDEFFCILNSKNKAGSEKASVDQIEKRSRSENSIGENVIRNTFKNVLGHGGSDKYIKIDSLMYLLPLSVIMLMLRKADEINGIRSPFVSGVIDFGPRPSQLRNVSKTSFTAAQKRIERAIKKVGNDELTTNRDKIIKSAVNGVKGYYPRSATAIGFTNSWTGTRYHVLNDALINALVMAEISCSGEEITLDEFCDRLFGNWGMVVNRESAEKAGLLKEMNGAVFEANAKEYFASSLRRLGVLREFSDQTKMVGISK